MTLQREEQGVRFMSRWELASTAPHLHEIRAMWFQTGTGSGLLFGSYRSLEQLANPDHEVRMAAKEAVILRCQGDLHRWVKVYSGAGELGRALRAGDDTFYALGVKHTRSHQRRSFLLK